LTLYIVPKLDEGTVSSMQVTKMVAILAGTAQPKDEGST